MTVLLGDMVIPAIKHSFDIEPYLVLRAVTSITLSIVIIITTAAIVQIVYLQIMCLDFYYNHQSTQYRDAIPTSG